MYLFVEEPLATLRVLFDMADKLIHVTGSFNQ